ncbi:MAG: radical SAM protein [Acidobacteriota bacterium]
MRRMSDKGDTMTISKDSAILQNIANDCWFELAQSLASQIADDARPRSPQIHLVKGGALTQLLVVDGTRLYDLPDDIAAEIESISITNDTAALSKMLISLGLDAPPAIDDKPLESPPVYALSLAVAQKCNLGCTYCYAQQGAFGGPAKDMSRETAYRAVDLLLEQASTGGRANLAFLGGEPLANRLVLREATEYAAWQAAKRNIEMRYSITTNGTLLTEDDAIFFEQYGFAVTISLDGVQEDHNRLRPFKSGAGSFNQIMLRVKPLLEIQRRMQVSARVTVTPYNLELPKVLDYFITMGFHSVGFSPLLRAPNGQNEMDQEHLAKMLIGMIACGLTFERQVLSGKRYPFLNMVNALRELHRGTHRPYPCGAGASYLGVSADGELAACHRFVDDPIGGMGNLETGIDREQQNSWLASRHVHFQEPCSGCWARYLCGGGCHHEVLARGRTACDFIRGWLHYTLQAYGRLSRFVPDWFVGNNLAE